MAHPQVAWLAWDLGDAVEGHDVGVAQLALHVDLLLEACQLGVAGVPCSKREGITSTLQGHAAMQGRSDLIMVWSKRNTFDCSRARLCVEADPTSTPSRLTIRPVDADHLDRDEAVEVGRHPHLPRAALPQLAVQGLAHVLPPDLRHKNGQLEDVWGANRL